MGINYFWGSDAKEKIKEAGLSKYPAIVKGFWKIGKLVNDDSFIGSLKNKNEIQRTSDGKPLFKYKEIK